MKGVPRVKQNSTCQKCFSGSLNCRRAAGWRPACHCHRAPTHRSSEGPLKGCNAHHLLWRGPASGCLQHQQQSPLSLQPRLSYLACRRNRLSAASSLDLSAVLLSRLPSSRISPGGLPATLHRAHLLSGRTTLLSSGLPILEYNKETTMSKSLLYP